MRTWPAIMDPYYKPEGPRLSQLQYESSMEEEEEEGEENSSEEGAEEVDFETTLETFTSTYELELQDLIQDLNQELERVSLSMEDGGEGGGGGEGDDLVVRDVGQEVGGGVMSQVAAADGGSSEGVELDVVCNGGRRCSHSKVNSSTGGLEEEGEEAIGGVCGGKRFVYHQTSSDSDADSVIVANATVAEHSNLANSIGSNNDNQVSKKETLEGKGLFRRHSECAHQGDFNNFEVKLKKAIRDLSSLMVREGGRVSLFLCAELEGSCVCVFALVSSFPFSWCFSLLCFPLVFFHGCVFDVRARPFD